MKRRLRVKRSLLLAFAVLALTAACRERAAPKEALVAKTPAAVWHRSWPYQETPRGLDGIGAAQCAKCHFELVEEWRTSAHAAAWHDAQFQAEWKKEQELWLCLNCHTPLANQQPIVVTGMQGGDFKKPVSAANPRFDAELRLEGVTCAVCHVASGAVIGSTGAGKEHHPIQVDRAVLLATCIGCHNARADLTATLVCNFDTGDDWRTTELPANGVSCIDCHMPEKPAAPEAGNTRPRRDHRFLGAGIPKLQPEVAPSGRSGLDIEVLTRPDGYRPGEPAPIVLRVTNARAGHTVPTGDVERFVLVRARLFDGERQLWEHVERFGETWVWFPVARRVRDDSLRRHETREVPLSPALPRDARSPRIEVVVENHRITDENHAAMKLPASYPKSVVAQRIEMEFPLAGAGRKENREPIPGSGGSGGVR